MLRASDDKPMGIWMRATPLFVFASCRCQAGDVVGLFRDVGCAALTVRAVAIFNLSKNAQPNKTRADRISYRFILEPVVEDSQLFFIVILIITI